MKTPVQNTAVKKTVWPLNVVAALLVAFAISLMGSDSATKLVTGISFTIALLACACSLKRRVNFVALLLAVVTLYLGSMFILFQVDEESNKSATAQRP